MRKKKKWGKIPATPGLTIFLLVIGLLNLFQMDYKYYPFGGGSGAFSFYRGPVLPMTGISGTEELKAARHVDFDFAPFARDWEALMDGQFRRVDVLVTDTYQLTNRGQTAVTADLAYPFEGRLTDPEEDFPAVTVDGKPVEAGLLLSVDAHSSVKKAGSWKAYRKAVEEGNHLEEALAAAPVLRERVKVYHFADIRYDGPEEPQGAFLRIRFVKPENTRLWAYNWKSGGTDAKTGEFDMMFGAEPDGSGEGWLLVAGEDIPAPEFSGNLTYNITETSSTDQVTYRLETYDATLEEMLRRFSKTYDIWIESHDYPPHALAAPEVLYEGAAKYLAGGIYSDTYGYVSIDNIFWDVAGKNRLMYRRFPVEIGPGETVCVQVRYHQEGSEDNGGMGEPRYGYDMATRLGSNLKIAELTASITNGEEIKITGQNMGFRLEQGTARVSLDPEKERYYLNVVHQ
ncbi:MAG: hypothetical protein IJB59_04300 [Oscillospiraceae bacterium]|nr:hypothetical protein [Oscillospiraceae bacterium]